MHMQIVPQTDTAELLDQLVEDQVPGRRGFGAWRSLLRAHATLMRRLDTDLERETGLALADFDVLAQLAEAHGELRMTELADRALISRSGMSRRVARLADEGLVRRDRRVPTAAVSWWRSPRPASAASLKRRQSTPRGSRSCSWPSSTT